MEVRIQKKPPAVVVEVQGDIDLYSSEEIPKILQRALSEHSPSALVMNLSGVKHIDSSGLAALVKGFQLCQRASIRFVLCGLNRSSRQVLQLTRLISVFEVAESEEEALSGNGS